ncbi:MAG: hypothetical protein WD830_11775 [Chloroflexota bacterium]
MDANEAVDVVRARRFEVVDADDRLRAVFGELATVESANEMFGIELFDRAGSARAWLLDEAGVGVQLVFAIGGNQVLVVEATDDTPHVTVPGVAVLLCDGSGAPVMAWRVSSDGSIVATGRPQPLIE